MRKILAFLSEVRAELAKVVWPTRVRAARLSVIVIIVTIIFGAFISGVDYGLSKGVQYAIKVAEKKDKPAPDGSPAPGAEQTLPVGAEGAQPVNVPPGGNPAVPAPGQ